ncbi:hypothetical protein [Amphibacillus cookii]|uniref:hypothetical protein n=1 Tax=Amphibacillus cookii TaxID=767787 RepID=UPI00195A414F|nr:hypothetical protein [Amphibacillus cookii]MBM7542546.1 hypothetical protein [Amphibacillus cookii]
MTAQKSIEKFQKQLFHLNTQLIKIEKKINWECNYQICTRHQNYAKQLFIYRDQLQILKKRHTNCKNKRRSTQNWRLRRA